MAVAMRTATPPCLRDSRLNSMWKDSKIMQGRVMSTTKSVSLSRAASLNMPFLRQKKPTAM